jgi:hypothetical protein
MSRFKNTKQKSFFADFPLPDLESKDDRLTIRCKFNFHYMDFTQKAGQKFSDWTKSQLAKMLEKLMAYSQQPLKHWEQERGGSGDGTVFAFYPHFPMRSITDFKFPQKKVPHQARWGRFRLGAKARLIGFAVPDEYHGKIHSGTKMKFDCNTFYAVFLDRDHKFWK